jgi:hypothetical protein
MDSFDFDDLLPDIIPIIAIGAVKQAQEQQQGKGVPRSTGQGGGDYLRELLNCGSDKRIYEVLRMRKSTFEALCINLRKKGLKDTRHLRVEEQVGMFIWTLNYSASSRAVAERFQHSKETVGRLVLLFY